MSLVGATPRIPHGTPTYAAPQIEGFGGRCGTRTQEWVRRSDDTPVELVVTTTDQARTGVITMSNNERTGSRRKRRIGVIAAVTALTAGGGVAWALWSASGTGSGTSTALTAQAITVTAAAGPATLYPGAADGDITFTLTNPNPYPVQLTAMTPGAITSSNAGACPITNVSVASATGLTINVAGGATSATQTIPDVVSMIAAAPDGCQGVSFTIALTLTGTQV